MLKDKVVNICTYRWKGVGTWWWANYMDALANFMRG